MRRVACALRRHLRHLHYEPERNLIFPTGPRRKLEAAAQGEIDQGLRDCQIHSREYDRDPSSSEAQLPISLIGLTLGRLAGQKPKAPFRYPRPQADVTA